MNKQNLNSFIIDIEELHKKVSDEKIKNELYREFENIKENTCRKKKQINTMFMRRYKNCCTTSEEKQLKLFR